MTSPSLRNRRTTRRNTRPSIDSRRWQALGLLVTLIVSCALPAMAEDAPSPTLDQLRTRSADARWQEIRQRWQLFSDEPLATDAAEEPNTEEPNTEEPNTEEPNTDEPTTGKSTSAKAQTMPTAVSASNGWNAVGDVQADDEHRIKVQSAEVTTPVLPVATASTAAVIVEAQTVMPKRTASTVEIETERPISLEESLAPPIATPSAKTDVPTVFQVAQDVSEDLTPQPATPGDDDATPAVDAFKSLPGLDYSLELKSITDISPFHDYSPRGNDPCESLCPRPDGECGEDRNRPCPDEFALPDGQSLDRHFAQITYQWAASNVHYNPLYFEDAALERYGHTYPEWVQPFASVGKFGVQFLGLPYQMSLHPVDEAVYPLGYYRPGEPAPHLRYQVPLNKKAAATTAGVYTGLFFLIP